MRAGYKSWCKVITREQIEALRADLKALQLAPDRRMEPMIDELCDTALDAHTFFGLLGAGSIAQPSAEPCSWSQDGEGSDIWATACGQYFCVNEGMPSENKFKFCVYCGNSLVDHPVIEEVCDDE